MNTNTNESQQENVNDGIDYIEALKEMKQNSVDRKTYDKVVAENKKLVETLVSGKQIELPKEEPVNIDELRKNLFTATDELSNLGFIENALKLRDALIEKGETDPFLPYGDKVDLTEDTVNKAQHVADVLRECVDFAQGDSGIFTAELQRRTIDTNPMIRKR